MQLGYLTFSCMIFTTVDTVVHAWCIYQAGSVRMHNPVNYMQVLSESLEDDYDVWCWMCTINFILYIVHTI